MKLTAQVMKMHEADTYTGRIDRVNKGWALTIDSLEFRWVFSTEDIQDVMRNTLSDANTSCDYASDGETYKFDVNRFDNYVVDDIKRFPNLSDK